jgi:hypothetical protein
LAELELGVGLGIEVVGEPVVERADDPGDRLVGEILLGDLAVVRVVDGVDRLVDDARVLVADQRVAQEAGQAGRMGAQVDPGEQQDQAEDQ